MPQILAVSMAELLNEPVAERFPRLAAYSRTHLSEAQARSGAADVTLAIGVTQPQWPSVPSTHHA